MADIKIKIIIYNILSPYDDFVVIFNRYSQMRNLGITFSNGSMDDNSWSVFPTEVTHKKQFPGVKTVGYASGEQMFLPTDGEKPQTQEYETKKLEAGNKKVISMSIKSPLITVSESSLAMIEEVFSIMRRMRLKSDTSACDIILHLPKIDTIQFLSMIRDFNFTGIAAKFDIVNGPNFNAKKLEREIIHSIALEYFVRRETGGMIPAKRSERLASHAFDLSSFADIIYNYGVVFSMVRDSGNLESTFSIKNKNKKISDGKNITSIARYMYKIFVDNYNETILTSGNIVLSKRNGYRLYSTDNETAVIEMRMFEKIATGKLLISKVSAEELAGDIENYFIKSPKSIMTKRNTGNKGTGSMIAKMLGVTLSMMIADTRYNMRETGYEIFKTLTETESIYGNDFLDIKNIDEVIRIAFVGMDRDHKKEVLINNLEKFSEIPDFIPDWFKNDIDLVVRAINKVHGKEKVYSLFSVPGMFYDVINHEEFNGDISDLFKNTTHIMATMGGQTFEKNMGISIDEKYFDMMFKFVHDKDSDIAEMLLSTIASTDDGKLFYEAIKSLKKPAGRELTLTDRGSGLLDIFSHNNEMMLIFFDAIKDKRGGTLRAIAYHTLQLINNAYDTGSQNKSSINLLYRVMKDDMRIRVKFLAFTTKYTRETKKYIFSPLWVIFDVENRLISSQNQVLPVDDEKFMNYHNAMIKKIFPYLESETKFYLAIEMSDDRYALRDDTIDYSRVELPGNIYKKIRSSMPTSYIAGIVKALKGNSKNKDGVFPAYLFSADSDGWVDHKDELKDIFSVYLKDPVKIAKAVWTIAYDSPNYLLLFTLSSVVDDVIDNHNVKKEAEKVLGDFVADSAIENAKGRFSSFEISLGNIKSLINSANEGGFEKLNAFLLPVITKIKNGVKEIDPLLPFYIDVELNSDVMKIDESNYGQFIESLCKVALEKKSGSQKYKSAFDNDLLRKIFGRISRRVPSGVPVHGCVKAIDSLFPLINIFCSSEYSETRDTPVCNLVRETLSATLGMLLKIPGQSTVQVKKKILDADKTDRLTSDTAFKAYINMLTMTLTFDNKYLDPTMVTYVYSDLYRKAKKRSVNLGSFEPGFSHADKVREKIEGRNIFADIQFGKNGEITIDFNIDDEKITYIFHHGDADRGSEFYNEEDFEDDNEDDNEESSSLKIIYRDKVLLNQKEKFSFNMTDIMFDVKYPYPRSVGSEFGEESKDFIKLKNAIFTGIFNYHLRNMNMKYQLIAYFRNGDSSRDGEKARYWFHKAGKKNNRQSEKPVDTAEQDEVKESLSSEEVSKQFKKILAEHGMKKARLFLLENKDNLNRKLKAILKRTS